MSEALLGYLLEPAAVAIQDDRLLGQFRVPLANHVHVLGIEFEAIADALGQFRGGQCRDNRIFLDIRDLDRAIEKSKQVAI